MKKIKIGVFIIFVRYISGWKVASSPKIRWNNKKVLHRSAAMTATTRTTGFHLRCMVMDITSDELHALEMPWSLMLKWSSYFVGLVKKVDPSIFLWKSRHVDFSLEKPTRRFLVEKADTSFCVDKGDTSIFSWKRAQFGPEFKLVLFELRSTGTGNHLARSVLYLSIFWYCFFNLSLLIKRKIFSPEMSAFFHAKRRVRFFNQKSTCRLFQRKIDESAFPKKNRCVRFFHWQGEHQGCGSWIFLLLQETLPIKVVLWLKSKLNIKIFYDTYFAYYNIRNNISWKNGTLSNENNYCWKNSTID